MRTAVLIALLVAGSSVPTFAADPPKGSSLADLMKQPANRAAWYAMFAGETPPQWIDDYGKTLDGPPTPSIAVEANGETYTLGFTCKPNECGDNQLFVLFSPSGAKAWGLLQTGNEKKWFGAPDKNVQDAILSSID
jgi:Inhibitor of vertebrate lysozyme (Ivy)